MSGSVSMCVYLDVWVGVVESCLPEKGLYAYVEIVIMLSKFKVDRTLYVFIPVWMVMSIHEHS